jgi:outer membrane protein, heavy metal efflux system
MRNSSLRSRKSLRRIAISQTAVWLLVIVGAVLFFVTEGWARDGKQQTADAGLSLAQLEQMALQSNPTIAQAEASKRSAQGLKRQAGLLPNPIVGYQGEQFAFRALSDKSEHFFFVEQTIPLGGKLGKSQRVFDRQIAEADIELAAQRQRVLNAVRMLYYDALGAQMLVDLRTELLKISRDATRTTGELLNVGQADQPDSLESEIESERAEIDLQKARNNFTRAWQSLAAVVGFPDLPVAKLSGNLEEALPDLNQNSVLSILLHESPEVNTARARVASAQAMLARAKADRIPDLFLRGGIGYSNEIIETRLGPSGMKTGAEANVQIGISLPVFNRNQGGIAAAQAQLSSAENEVRRIELSVRFRIAEAFQEYNDARDTVRRYREAILPRAEKAYNLYLASFRQMAASYPQVLISQRTLFQSREKYLDALVRLKRAAIHIQGNLLSGGLSAPRELNSGMSDSRQGSPAATAPHLEE